LHDFISIFSLEKKSMSLIHLEVSSDYVAKITFQRSEAKNAISRDFLDQFWKAVREVSHSNARVLLITGSGDSFCAGADLKERADWKESDVVKFLNDFRDCLLALEALPIPSIACINGFAFGGGLELALACDLRYASHSAIVGLTETKLGIIPGAGGTQRLTRLVGLQTASEWIFRAKKIDPSEGLTKGLFAAIFNQEALADECFAVARDIAQSAPIAVKAAKKAILGALSLELKSGLEWERICYYDTIRTKDRSEALSAFKEKRKPNFVGE
jgi:enoyl-CoA hydratase/carnithine racemase